MNSRLHCKAKKSPLLDIPHRKYEQDEPMPLKFHIQR